jgi:hypothetical protein
MLESAGGGRANDLLNDRERTLGTFASEEVVEVGEDEGEWGS